jgi:hypothetical protein
MATSVALDVPVFAPITSHVLLARRGPFTLIVVSPVDTKPPEIACWPLGQEASELAAAELPDGMRLGGPVTTVSSWIPDGPRGPRCPCNAFFALGLMSASWIVPFLMFFDVTRIVAAVPLAAETIAETTAATNAVFMLLSPFPS